MSWEPLEKRHYAECATTTRAGLNFITRNESWRLGLYIGKKIIRKLGWNVGLRVSMEYGTRSDTGWIRLVLFDRGLYRLRYSNQSVKDGSLWLTTQRTIPGMVQQRVPTQAVKHILPPGGELMIHLPEHFWQHNIDEKKHPHKPSKSVDTKQNGHLTV